MDQAGLCLLSLDGGGVRGLSTLHILKRIMNEINRLRKEKDLPPHLPCQVFDMIGGTSTGGQVLATEHRSSLLTHFRSLIAIMLGRLGMSVDECIEAYEDLMGSIFGAKAHWPISASAKVNPQFDSQKVKTAIEKVLCQRDIAKDSLFNDGNERRCRVYVMTSILFEHY